MPITRQRQLQRLVFGLAFFLIIFSGYIQEFLAGSYSWIGTLHPQSPLTLLHQQNPPSTYEDGLLLEVIDISSDQDDAVSAELELIAQHFGLQGENDNTVEEIALIQAKTGHDYLDNGLLVVNPDSGHPIPELIQRAEEAWQAKLDRQSKTLGEAVAEYRRRYGRAPPRGFDHWWNYVQAHNVLLPDEYDQIDRDLAHYWGVHPYDLHRLLTAFEQHDDSFVLSNDNEDHAVRVATHKLSDEHRAHFLSVAQEHIDLLEPVQEFLPPFRALFTPHDNPLLVADWTHKQMALNASASSTYVSLANLPPPTTSSYASSCPPDAPIHNVSASASIDANNKPKTFIHDHRLSMDACQHPAHLRGLGQFLARTDPVAGRTLVPQFAYCSTPMHTDIVVTTAINWDADLDPALNPAWDAREDGERLMWRGSPTGVFYGAREGWIETQRARLVRLVNEASGWIKVLVPPGLRDDGDERVGAGREVDKAEVNQWFDIGFSGSGEIMPDRVSWIEEYFRESWKDPLSFEQAGTYKFALDVDGNGWSARFKRLITSNALIFKVTAYPEWYVDRIQPWVHYVPVQIDYSDLYDAFAFFRSSTQQETAKRIAEQGREWSLSMWRKEDMTAYMFRLFLEYARIMSVDRDEMSFTLP